MQNIKKMFMPAIFGFALSFLISLVASRKFFVSLGRGVIFAVVFAGLFLLIDFIFSRFLDSDSPGLGKKASPERGKMVDITIADEELSDAGDDLKFPVSQNRVGLGAENLDGMRKQSSPAEERPMVEPAPSVDSVPMAEQVEEIPAKKESAPQAAAPAKTETPKAAPAADSGFTPVPLGTSLKDEAAVSRAGDVDELPDMMDFDSELGTEDDGFSTSDIINDSDFAESGNSGYSDRPTFSDGSRAADHDAATLAKAIQTILKKEE